MRSRVVCGLFLADLLFGAPRTSVLSAMPEGAVPAAQAVVASAVGPCTALAGRYSSGDGFTSLGLRLTPDCRATFSTWSDDGQSWEETVAGGVADGVLTFGSVPAGAPHQRPDRFVPVPWGKRAYLVPEARIVTFCNAVNAGHEPSRVAWVVLRDGQRAPSPTGLPDVPPAVRARLLAAPLRGKVVRVERPERTETVVVGDCEERRLVSTELVRVDLGSRDGLLTGMLLFASNPRRPSLSALLEVTEVAEAEAFAEVRDQGIAHVKVNDTLSTRESRSASPR